MVWSTGFAAGNNANAEGWLREKIKQRIGKKLEADPAPLASTDVVSKIDKPGTHDFKIMQGDLRRYYRVHVPASYDAKKLTPVIVVLHGGGGDMTIQSNEEYYHQISSSEKQGFIAVFPNGYSKFQSGKLATWNAGGCCAEARDKKIDDVGFIRTVIKNLGSQLSIDRNRVFATGISNGGMMSYRLACEMADTFKAIAAVAASDGTVTCQPNRPISILHIHAKDDDHVLFDGGAGPGRGTRDKAQVMDFPSVPSVVAKWVKLNKCDSSPKRVLDKPGVYCDLYSKCEAGVSVELCVTDSGGHSWPGGKKPRGGEGSTAISANEVMWEFFNRK